MGPLAISRLSRMREAQFRRTASTTFRIILVVGRFRVSRFLHISKMADLYLLKRSLKGGTTLRISIWYSILVPSKNLMDTFLAEEVPSAVSTVIVMTGLLAAD